MFIFLGSNDHELMIHNKHHFERLDLRILQQNREIDALQVLQREVKRT
jgi:hypothetical protein